MNPSLALIPSAYSAGKLYSVLPKDGTGDFNVSRNGTATYFDKNGIIQTAQANEPRLEFNTDGSFRGVLVEPAATNLIPLSNVLGFVISSTKTLNFGTSPDGSQNSLLINFGDLSQNGINLNVNQNNLNGNYIFSAWCKSSVNTSFVFRVYNFSNMVILSQVVNVTTDWQRITVPFTLFNNEGIGTNTRIMNGEDVSGKSIEFFGAQLEEGSVATSYIPTEGSTVTKPADVITRTNAQDLIGQTEGSVFIEGQLIKFTSNSTRMFIDITSSNDADRVYIDLPSSLNANLIQAAIRADSVFQAVSQRAIVNLGHIKAAIAYSSGDCSFYVNGVKVNFISNNNFNFSLNLTSIRFGVRGNNISSLLNDNITSITLFKTRLSDTQLQALTTL